MFRIILHKSASKKFAKLSSADRARMSKIIESLAINPYSGKKLHGEFEGCRRIRMGDYRIIYDIIESDKIVLIHAIGSRGDVYK